VSIPPLRDRKEDILVLADHFLREFCADLGRPSPSLSDAAASALLAHDWPGNVRELKNAMQHLALLCDDSVIEPQSLPGWLLMEGPPGIEVRADSDPLDTPLSLKESKRRTFVETEKRQIAEALRVFDGNRTRAAEYLGISRRSLQLKIKHYGL
jgi:DNA-binding NtrC family response regulator